MDKDSIKYTIKFSAGAYTGGLRGAFSYEHFTNLSVEEAFKLNGKQGGSHINPLTANNTMSQPGIT